MLVDITYVIIDLLRLQVLTPIYFAQLRTDFHWGSPCTYNFRIPSYCLKSIGTDSFFSIEHDNTALE